MACKRTAFITTAIQSCFSGRMPRTVALRPTLTPVWLHAVQLEIDDVEDEETMADPLVIPATDDEEEDALPVKRSMRVDLTKQGKIFL